VSYPPPPAGFNSASWQGAARLGRLERVVLACAGSVLVGLVATAAWLTPSSSGMGTHQQLGLPPCTVVVWLGQRCPSCGMTTSWSCLLRGRIGAALAANAGGTLLAIAAIAGGPWLVGSSLVGRWLGGIPREGWVLAFGILVVTVTLVQWTLRISLGW
jgi:hypothetical protein